MRESVTEPAGDGPATRPVQLSSQQLGLWFIHQANPKCGAYHLVFSAQACADESVRARAEPILADLAGDYEALRVCFRSGDDGPVQVVAGAVKPDIRRYDARALDPASLLERVRDDSRQPFDLSQPPLWRIHLYRTGERQWIITVVAHHIAIDFWSLMLLLGDARSRLAGGQGPSQLDGSAFADHASQQRAFLSSAAAELLGETELLRLKGAPAVLDLFGDHSRPPLASYEGRSVAFSLSPEVSERVRDIARTCGATPYIVVLAAYLVVLSRWSGQAEILVGTPASGRLRRRFRQALGNFVNTIVIRGMVDERSTYRELIGATREQVLAAMQGQELPLPWLIQRLSPARDPSRTPLYQAGLAWDRLPFEADLNPFFLLEPDDRAELTVPGATLRPYPVPQQEGQTDLWIEMGGARDTAYVGVLRYNTDVFAEGTARELTASFVATLETMTASPDRPMSTLRRGSDNQIARLDSWGRGQVRAVPGQTLPALILARGALNPDAPAVVDSALTLSHGDLRRHVKAIAAALKKAGVARGDRVAVMLGRDALLIPALLGVLDAGAAYVPLDPRFPARRLKYMAEDSGARVLLTRSDLRPGWPMTVCHVDRILADGTQPEVPTAASDLAYILYTSGSTGHPKGVAVSHRALVNLLLAMREQTGFCSSDSLLAVTTISFDIAGLELFLPLLAGGTVVICDGDTSADGKKLAARIADSGVTWMQATPTMWRMLRDAGWAGSPGLHALCGGEELPAELAAFLTPRVASLRNVYGPTETTIWSTAGSVRRFPPVDLGTPLANTEVYVADPWGRRTEPGAPGEIWIGGDGLAEGYWNRPDLTTERFRTGLPCAPGKRLYQTGDRGRWTGDGRLLHLGRLDTQVKLRGFRVELGEVESTLLSVAGVIEAVAVVRDDQLVAYVVTDNRDALTAASIKAAVLGILPAYMVPSVVVILSELPLTANGKIDRNRLPDPQFRDSAAPYVEPRDAVEIGLTRIWSELLRVPRIGVHDDFFDLGGHSLLSTRVATAIRQEWGIDIAVADLLRYPTIAQLGALLRLGAREGRAREGSAGEGRAEDGRKSPLVTIRAGQPDHRPLFLFHPFGGTVFCYVAVARQFPPGRPVIAVEAPGIQREDDSEVTVEAMAARYLEYVRGIQAHGPYALGGWCFGGVIAFEVARRLRSAGEDIEILAAIDARAPIAANMPEIPDDWTMLSWFARDLAVPAGKKLQIPAGELRGLGAQAGFDRVLAGATEIGVLAEDADRATLRRYFEVYLANGIALQTYLPQASDLDMLVLRARDETEDYGPSLGWDSLIRGSLDVEQVPGDHNSVMYPQHAPSVAAAMAQRYCKGAGR